VRGNGSEETIWNGRIAYTGFDSETTGTKTVTGSFLGATSTFQVQVEQLVAEHYAGQYELVKDEKPTAVDATMLVDYSHKVCTVTAADGSASISGTLVEDKGGTLVITLGNASLLHAIKEHQCLFGDFIFAFSCCRILFGSGSSCLPAIVQTLTCPRQIPVSIVPMTQADAELTNLPPMWQTSWTSEYLSAERFEKYAAKVGDELIALGAYEILNNSLTAESYYNELPGYPADHCVKLLNPLSNDLSVMRQTLLFGGLESLSHNINRKMADLRMFEFGNVYFFNPAAESTADRVLAPYSESSRLALWMTGALRPGNWARKEEEATVYDLKAVVANIFARLGINPAEIRLSAGTSGLYAAGLDIATRSGKVLGTLGILSKKIAASMDIKQQVVYCELDWHALVNLSIRKKVSYSPLARTMPVKRDLALLLDKSVSMEQVEATVRESERRLLKDVSLFDVYEGKNLPEGKKSYAIAITLQDDEKTLQDKQIEAVMNKVITNLTKKLGAELR